MEPKTYKVIGGVLAGIGTVAALPILGPLGSVSLLGAVLGGAAGGLTGATLAEIEEEECSHTTSTSDEEEVEVEENEWIKALTTLQESSDESAMGKVVAILHLMTVVTLDSTSSITIFLKMKWMQDLKDALKEIAWPDSVRDQINTPAKEASFGTITREVLKLTPEMKGLLKEVLESAPSGEELRDQQSKATDLLELVRSLIEESTD